MSDNMEGQAGFRDRLVDGLERLFALRVVETDRLDVPIDPHNIYIDSISNRRPMRVAAILAFLFHIFLFIMVWPSFGNQVLPMADKILQLRNLARPAGGGPPKPMVTEVVKKIPPKPKPKRKLMPIPDPTPLDPEPITREQTLEVSPVLDELSIDLTVGDITGPPGQGNGVAGTGSGPFAGPGSSDAADGVYTVGGGVLNPTLIKQTLPKYTDEAIKAKVQGIILLKIIVRKDGSVDSPKIIKQLGYGLDEVAINEITHHWQFRPGTLNGAPVDVWATVEVAFTLR